MAAKKAAAAVPPKKNLPARTEPKAPRGRGFEEADAESFAIPFLALLQKSSPQADPDDSAYIKGAKPGMFINTVTLDVFDGVEVIPCAYQRRFNRWAPRDAGGGFKGMFMKSAISGMEASGQIAQNEDGRWFFPLPDGSINEKKCDVLNDTRMHYCLLLNDGEVSNVLISLSRTQLKKSRTWMTLMDQRGGDMWGTVYHITSVVEENDKGKWFGWSIETARASDEAEATAAESLYDAILAGTVKVKMDTSHDE